MPWRDHPTPYRVWVSEVMLQQTQVATVIPYFERFMARFPDLASLAQADESEVLALWEGLGYYRRARLLVAAARALTRAGGQLPDRYDCLRKLPGLGPYTAAAVASIAFGQPIAVVDGNVRRVLSRLLGAKEMSEAQLRREAQALLDPDSPGDFNQAMMELGATVCSPKAPRCRQCPARDYCRARRLGRPEAFPPPRPRPATVPLEEHAAALFRRGRWLLARRDGGERYRGLWELPRCRTPLAAPLVEWVETVLGLIATACGESRELTYSITHHRVRLVVHPFRVQSGRARRGLYAEVRWLAPAELEDLPMSAPMRRAVRLLVGRETGVQTSVWRRTS